MINILFCGNENAFKGMLIASLSAAKNTKRPLSLFILTADLQDIKTNFVPLTAAHAACIETAVKKYNSQSRVRLIDITGMFKERMGDCANMFNHYTPYAFLRLFATSLDLPQKLLYLDIDVVARRDIAELYDIDMSGYELAAAKDYQGQIFIKPSYFNSGVMLLNLAKIRETGLFDKTLDRVRHRRMMMPDQSALNKYARYKLYISPKYNRQRHPKADTVIQHFIRKLVFLPFPRIVCVKPWEIDRVHKKYKIFEYDDIFAEYLAVLEAFDKEKAGNTYAERMVAATTG